MITVRHSNDRGSTQLSWLNSRHSFSFGHYQDPRHNGFSDLLVINDDCVQPSAGFETHPHRDMEIVSYVLSGSLEHKDSIGNGSVILPGDVQIMSAGTGIRHSEFNPSDDTPVHFLQIWIKPSQFGATPRYQQAHVPIAEKTGRLRCLIAPNAEEGVLAIRQEAYLYAGLFSVDETVTYALKPGRCAYVFAASGEVRLNERALTTGDGAQVKNETRLELTCGQDAEVLLIDLRAE